MCVWILIYLHSNLESNMMLEKKTLCKNWGTWVISFLISFVCVANKIKEMVAMGYISGFSSTNSAHKKIERVQSVGHGLDLRGAREARRSDRQKDTPTVHTPAMWRQGWNNTWEPHQVYFVQHRGSGQLVSVGKQSQVVNIQEEKTVIDSFYNTVNNHTQTRGRGGGNCDWQLLQLSINNHTQTRGRLCPLFPASPQGESIYSLQALGPWHSLRTFSLFFTFCQGFSCSLLKKFFFSHRLFSNTHSWVLPWDVMWSERRSESYSYGALWKHGL